MRPLVVAIVVLALCAGVAAAAKDDSGDQLAFGVKMAQRGLWSEALFRFRQAERLGPASARTYNNLAVAYEALGRFEEALEAYQQGLRVEPGNSELKKNYGRFLEFYQSFKPKEEEATEAASATSGETEVRDESG